MSSPNAGRDWRKVKRPLWRGGRPTFFLFSSNKMPGGVTVKDVCPHEFIKALAAHLKKGGKLKVPEWVDLVKTAKRKELAPYDPDWYYIRAASILRHVYLRSGIGVGHLTRVYGGRKRRGVRPSHFERGSSSIARNILKGLEQLKMVEKDNTGGRAITSQGQRDLDRIACQVVPSS